MNLLMFMLNNFRFRKIKYNKKNNIIYFDFKIIQCLIIAIKKFYLFFLLGNTLSKISNY